MHDFVKIVKERIIFLKSQWTKIRGGYVLYRETFALIYPIHIYQLQIPVLISC